MSISSILPTYKLALTNKNSSSDLDLDLGHEAPPDTCAQTHTFTQCHPTHGNGWLRSHMSHRQGPLPSKQGLERQGAQSLKGAAGIISHLCMIYFGLNYKLLTSKKNFRKPNQVILKKIINLCAKGVLGSPRVPLNPIHSCDAGLCGEAPEPCIHTVFQCCMM